MAGNQSIEAAKRQVIAAQGAGNRAMEATALVDLGRIYAEAGQSVEACTAFEEAVAAARDAADQPTLAKALANAGSQLHLAGQSGEGLELSRQAVLEFRGLGDKRSELRTLANCAAIEQALGQPGDAALTAETALTIAREIDDRELQPALNGLHAEMLELLGRPSAARTARQQAVMAARKTNDPTLLADQLEALGEMLLVQSAHDEAIKIYTEAGALHAQRGDATGCYRAVLQQGLIYQHLARWAEAQEALSRALDFCMQLRDTPRVPYIRANLASVMLGTKNFNDAAALAADAAEGYRSFEDRIGTGRALATRAQALEALSSPDTTACYNEALELLTGVDPAGEQALRALIAG